MTPAADRFTQGPDFDALYAKNDDPWSVASSWYERRKLAVLLACLPRERYATAWEPGCGPGFTSRALAPRVGHLVATDASGVAVDLARRRCRDLPHVEIERRTLLDGPDHPPVELVVAAEFLYYVDDLDAALEALWLGSATGGQVAVMHWAHHPHDTVMSGRMIHDRLASDAERRGHATLVRHDEQDFGLDIYEVR